MMYDRIMPIGLRGEYWQAGLIASAILNVNRGKSDKAFAPEDFIPSFDPPKKVSGKQAARALKAALFDTFGDRVKDDRQG